ncbi:MAG: rod shape-determining protein MreC [Desulfobacteraceae bacterium]|jgi:rod shape-determining protein MreC|nr:MAG: rod shape-determining protein MreC [Desulfobacteraceae bacterium]
MWVAGVVAVVFFVLLSWGLRSGREWNLLEKAVVEVTSTVQSLITSTVETVERFWLRYFYLVGAGEENISLKKENDDLRRELSIYRELLSGCERLEELFQFRKSLEHQTMAARVVGLDPSGLFRSVIIDKGGRDGLDLDMAVINARGVVGRIVSISYNYSKVLLIIDQNSSVDSFVQRSRERGMVKGVSEKLCKLEYVAQTGDVMVEDIVVTSGLEGIFPKGVPLGKVSAVRSSEGGLFKDIDIEPAVSFSRLEEVLVVLGGAQ